MTTRTYSQWEVSWPIDGKPCVATYSDRGEANKELARRKGAVMTELVCTETWTVERRAAS